MKKSKSTGIVKKFGPRYGTHVKKKYLEVALKQIEKQKCPFCKKKGVKRIAKGLWLCKKCNKKFADSCYYLTKED